jgi:prolyl-tRNA synthetase
MVMIHGDDKGLVLPPRVAPIQVVVIPVPFKGIDPSDECLKVVHQLQQADFRVKADLRDNYSPGWKYSHWELKGVPLRIEIGPRDIEKKQVRVVRRDLEDKAVGRSQDIPVADLVERIGEILDEMQKGLLERARKERSSCIATAYNWDDFMAALNNKKMVLAPWCDEVAVEENVKARTKCEGDGGGAKTLCMPFEQDTLPVVQDPLPEGIKCFASGKPAKKWALWGRSY